MLFTKDQRSTFQIICNKFSFCKENNKKAIGDMQRYYGKSLKERPGKITLYSPISCPTSSLPLSSSYLICFFISTVCTFFISIWFNFTPFHLPSNWFPLVKLYFLLNFSFPSWNFLWNCLILMNLSKFRSLSRIFWMKSTLLQGTPCFK